MADILISGMSIPRTMTAIIIFPDGTIRPFETMPNRAEWENVKAVQLPPHGRLIDADVMVEGLMKCAKNPPDDDQESRWFYLFAAEIAKSCETIVPAEGGS